MKKEIMRNGAPRAKARGSPRRNTRAAIVHPCPKGQGFWPRKYKKIIGIIGTGNMGAGIAGRIKNKYNLWIFDKDKAKALNIQGAQIANSIADLVDRVNVVILAVKPKDFDCVLAEIKDKIDNKLVISIAAGIDTVYIQKYLGNVRVIRVMPNMPAKIGRGMSCISKGEFANSRDLAFALRLFRYLGKTLVLGEDMIDAATAISGSGPGFLYYLIKNKTEGDGKNYTVKFFIPEFTLAAQNLGFSKKDAKLLVTATAYGALATILATGESPEQLEKQVTSQAGTTEAGLGALQETGSLTQAASAALKRAKELSGG